MNSHKPPSPKGYGESRKAQKVNTRLLVLMPCLNEEGRIGPVIRSVREVLPSASVVVVNDASCDGSVAEASEAGAVVLSHGCNLGYGAALETGYLYAVKHGYDIVLQMDGDGQHPANQLPALMEPLLDGSADLVIGSRHCENSKTEATSWLRSLGHRILSLIIFLLTGLRLSDPTSGFQGLNRVALSLFASGVFPCDYPDSDVMLMACISGLRIREIPVQMRERVGGKSMHSGLRPLYYSIKMLLSMFIVLLNFRVWHRWRREQLLSESAYEG